MSNIRRIFFAFLWMLWLPTLSFSQSTTIHQDSLIQKGDFFFQYERFTEGIQTYEQLLEQGFLQEKILYRLAFMHEQLGHFPETIYYLRKIQWEFGGDHLDRKVIQLMGKITQERVSPGETWTAAQVAVHQQEIYLLATMGLATILILLISIFWGRYLSRMLGIFLTSFTLLGAVLLVSYYLFLPPKGVMLQGSRFFEAPGYSAPATRLPIHQGATVNIEEEQDIWMKISMGKYSGWVPAKYVKEI